MAVHGLSRVIQSLRTTTFPDEASASDGQLLDRFLECQDEGAFAALVKRHSPMVWGVCRRIVAHHQDAEDAFQATFLVLARKAASVRPREMLANWLFGVAQRTALKAKTMAAKRHSREKQMTAMPEPEAAGARPSWANLESLIDQELAKVPDKYRIAIVLCDLEGKKGKDAARQLKIPEGTLASRLRTGRILLAKRLARRGLALSGGALATALSKNAASACAPTGLVSSTIKAATLTATGRTVAAGIISANAKTLMDGVIKAMLLTKLKTVITGLLLINLVALGGGWLSVHAATGQLTRSVESEKPADQQEVPDARIVPYPMSQVPVPKREPQETEQEGAQRVVYQVLDLVTPIPGLDFAANSNKKEDRKTKEDWLIRKIKQSVSPASWKDTGGSGTIEYHATPRALVVINTPRVQTQVKHLLQIMRRVQDIQVVAETRVIWLNAACFLKLQETLPLLKKDGHALLSETETSALIRQAQDDAQTNVMQTPKITFFPGQQTGCSINSDKDEPGIDLRLNALVAGNLQHIELDVKATIGKVQFSKALRLEDGATLAQFKRNDDGYLMLLVTPRVILETEELILAPPAVKQN